MKKRKPALFCVVVHFRSNPENGNSIRGGLYGLHKTYKSAVIHFQDIIEYRKKVNPKLRIVYDHILYDVDSKLPDSMIDRERTLRTCELEYAEGEILRNGCIIREMINIEWRLVHDSK